MQDQHIHQGLTWRNISNHKIKYIQISSQHRQKKFNLGGAVIPTAKCKTSHNNYIVQHEIQLKQSVIPFFGSSCFFRGLKQKNVWGLCEPQKNNLLLSIESWLFNKNPYFMVFEITPIQNAGSTKHPHLKNPQQTTKTEGFRCFFFIVCTEVPKGFDPAASGDGRPPHNDAKRKISLPLLLAPVSPVGIELGLDVGCTFQGG